MLVGHVHHGLRGAEADLDEEFVRRLAAERGADFLLERGDARSVQEERRLSPEAAARALRYAAFRKWAAQRDVGALFLGHHLDDQAETILLRAIRGAGIHGLGGIPAVRPLKREGGSTLIVRPLLGWRRRDILEFLAERGQAYRTDATNLDTSVPRNLIRSTILPLLEREVQPGAALSLARLGAMSSEVTRDLEALGASVLREATVAGPPGFVSLSAEVLRRWSPTVVREVLLAALETLRGIESGEPEGRGPPCEAGLPDGGTTEIVASDASLRVPPSIERRIIDWLQRDSPRECRLEFGAGRARFVEMRYGVVRLGSSRLGRPSPGLGSPGARSSELGSSGRGCPRHGDSVVADPEAPSAADEITLGAGGPYSWRDWDFEVEEETRSSCPGEVAPIGAPPTEASLPPVGFVASTASAPAPASALASAFAQASSAASFEERLDAEKVRAAGALRVRSRKCGDRLVPLGAPGSKSLKEFFRERRVWPSERDAVPIVVAGETLVWVVGHRIDDRFRTGPGTRNVLVLRARRRVNR